MTERSTGPKRCERCNRKVLKRDLSVEGLCLLCHSTVAALPDIPLKKREIKCFYCDKPLKGDVNRTVQTWHKECRRQALEKLREVKAVERQRLIDLGKLEPRTCRGCGQPLAWGHGLQWYHEECKLERDRLHQREAQRRYRAKLKGET